MAPRIWRVVRADRDPLRGSTPSGRWDDGTFDVLYTSIESDGALAEMYFHILRGQPIFPSEMAFKLYELQVTLERILKIVDHSVLELLGLDMKNYGSLMYARKNEEYTRMQQIGEAAHFFNFDGLIAPSARWDCQNLVIFSNRVPPQNLSIAVEHGPVDWTAWESKIKSI